MSVRQVRAARGAAASAIATLLAAVSHTLAGGAAPAPLLVAAVAALLTPAAMVFLGRRQSIVRLSATVLVAQAAFHTTFFALGSPTGITGLAHVHGDAPVLGTVAPSVLPDAAMLLAHAFAAAATIALLARGERLVAAITAWTRALLRRSAAALPSAPVRLRVSVPWSRPVRGVAARTSVTLRGPPAAHGA